VTATAAPAAPSDPIRLVIETPIAFVSAMPVAWAMIDKQLAIIESHD
jgi:hypothetical protein